MGIPPRNVRFFVSFMLFFPWGTWWFWDLHWERSVLNGRLAKRNVEHFVGEEHWDLTIFYRFFLNLFIDYFKICITYLVSWTNLVKKYSIKCLDCWKIFLLVRLESLEILVYLFFSKCIFSIKHRTFKKKGLKNGKITHVSL